MDVVIVVDVVTVVDIVAVGDVVDDGCHVDFRIVYKGPSPQSFRETSTDGILTQKLKPDLVTLNLDLEPRPGTPT